MGDARAGRGFDSAPLHEEKRGPPTCVGWSCHLCLMWDGTAVLALCSLGSWASCLQPYMLSTLCLPASSLFVFWSSVPHSCCESLRPLPEHWLGRGWPPLLSRPSAHLACKALDTVDLGVSGLSGTLHPSMPNMCCLSCQRPSSDPTFQRGAEGPLGVPGKPPLQVPF